MSFYVHVGTAAAFVHRADCTHCNAGRGIRRRAAYSWAAAHRAPTVTWLGPFNTLDDAVRQAEESRRNRVKVCGHCSPGEDTGDTQVDRTYFHDERGAPGRSDSVVK